MPSNFRGVRFPAKPRPSRLCVAGCLLLLGFLVAVDAAAQQGAAISVDEAVRLALDRNVRLRTARAEAEEARAAWREAVSAGLPAVRAQASYTRLAGDIPEAEFTFPGFDTTFTILPIERNRVHSEISIEQPLFTGLEIRNRIRAAARMADASEEMLAQEEADVALSVREAYWNLVQALAMQDALDASLALVDEHVRAVTVRVEEETALRRDLLAARTRRSEVELERVEADNAVRLARLELNRLTGIPLDAPTTPADSTGPVAPSLPDSLSALIDVALASRPQLKALEDQAEALRLQVAATRGAWLPNLAAVGRYVYARPNPYVFTEQSEFRGTGELGLTLRWDLFVGGRRSSQTRQAEARAESAEAALAEAREQVVLTVTRQYLEFLRAAEAMEVAERHLEEAAETYRVARRQFEEEVALPSDVLDAERVYREAQARRVQAMADRVLADAALLNALGRVW